MAVPAFVSLGAFPPNTAVSVFDVGTETLATLYTSETGLTTASNPATTDALGDLRIFAAAADYTLSWQQGDVIVSTTVTIG